ncbi:MAG: T9SS type A sorting domain-containing protein [Bacteroidales bacterium]|nr:T9SS type A sorting domain-containing protein [Bacteroidales bacterium]MBN2698822.1 T9SS type A sorting domain-containing protein [Bacteroidales bacterium]
MKKIYKSFIAVALILASVSTTAFSQKAVMLIGRSASLESLTYQSEQDLFDSLAAWGYGPVYFTGADAASADFSQYDGILVSEQISSGDVNYLGDPEAETYIPIPIVNMEGYVPRDGRWNWLSVNDETTFIHTAEGEGSEDDQYIVIKDNNHWITRNFNVDDEIRWTTGEIEDPTTIRSVSFIEENQTYTSKLAVSRAHQDMDGFWTMIAIEDTDLPNRVFLWGMLGMGLDAGTTGVSEGTPEFFQIIHNACEWAFDGMTVGVKEVSREAYELAAFPNPASENFIVRFNAPVHGQAVATLYNITGQRIATFTRDAVAGKNFIQLNAGDYAAGIYHLGLELNGHIEYLKLVIQ